MSYDNWKTQAPDLSGECTLCDNGEVCGECLLHPDDKCECESVARYMPCGTLTDCRPDLDTCEECEGRGYIED